MGIHDGHRARLRDQFAKGGLDALPDVNVLELLLFYTIPRRDVNPIAHELLSRFGSLSGVMDAPIEELCQVPGISELTAMHLHLIPQAARRYLNDSADRMHQLNTVDKVGEYLMPRFFGERDEVVYLLCLDAKCSPIGLRLIARGSVNSAAVPPRKVVQEALSANATSVVLAHNHPSGIALPSSEDHAVTETIFRALDAVNVLLADHLIFAGNDYVSLAHNGLIQKLMEGARRGL